MTATRSLVSADVRGDFGRHVIIDARRFTPTFAKGEREDLKRLTELRLWKQETTFDRS